MFSNFKFLLVIFQFLILFSINIFSQSIGQSWEFNNNGNFEGIIIGNSLQDSMVENGSLSVKVSGSFPSLSSQSFLLEANDFGYIQIRMKIDGATSGKIMWDNDSDSWGFSKFLITGDSSFQIFEIPVYLSNQWKGKITKIKRLDFNPTIGSLIEIDYIRIVRIGSKPTIINFAPLRTVFKINEEIHLIAFLNNSGDVEAQIGSKLILPNEVRLVNGSFEKNHGVMFKELEDTLNWVITSDFLGDFEIVLKVFNESDTTEKIILLNVTDKFWTPDKFFLSAWSPPYAWYGPPYEDVIFEDYKNANFDNVLWVRPEDELLAKVKKYDLKYFLLVTNIVGGDKYLRAPDKKTPPDITEEMLINLDVIIEKYKDDPNLLGYHICDEPREQAFPNIGKVIKRIRVQDPTRLSFVNIWPSGEGYRDYIDELLQVTQLEILSYDRYHFFNGYDGGTYFSNISVIRESALKYNIPFYNIIQAIGTNGTVESHLNWRTPNEAEHRWLVYSSLAYGVHGLIWFHWHLDWGLTGNPDREIIYHSIKKINTEIDSLSQIMLKLNTTGVYHSETSEKKRILPSHRVIKSTSDNAKLVIGYFNDKDDNKYFMLMNKDYSNSSTFQVSLNGITDNLICFDVDSSSWKNVTYYNEMNSTHFEVQLRPGGGKLFMIGTLTDIDHEVLNILPESFRLYQNYPNPFNPNTTIKYSIPFMENNQPVSIQIKIYDILGRQVARLINEKKNAGNYEVKFDASKLSSGIYLYRLEANSPDYNNEIVLSKKMILIK